MKNTVFFDLESKKVSTDFRDGWGEKIPHFWNEKFTLTDSNILRMDMSLACTHDSNQIRFWDDPTELLLFLASDEVDQIVTFNGERFDFPLLLGCLSEPTKKDGKWEFDEAFITFYKKLTDKSIDLLLLAEGSLGHRVSLDQITSALFDQKKLIDGLEFRKYLTSPDPSKVMIAYNYLLADVVQLYKVYGIAHEFGMAAYRDNLGEVKKFELKVPPML